MPTEKNATRPPRTRRGKEGKKRDEEGINFLHPGRCGVHVQKKGGNCGPGLRGRARRSLPPRKRRERKGKTAGLVADTSQEGEPGSDHQGKKKKRHVLGGGEKEGGRNQKARP